MRDKKKAPHKRGFFWRIAIADVGLALTAVNV